MGSFRVMAHALVLMQGNVHKATLNVQDKVKA